MTAIITPLKTGKTAALGAADTLDRTLQMQVDAGRIDDFTAAVIAFEAFERRLRALETARALADGTRNLDASAVIRGVAETRLARWRACALDPPFDWREMP